MKKILLLILAMCLSITSLNGRDAVTPGAAPEPAPAQPDWTEWSETLPDFVTDRDYAIESRTLYSTRELETARSVAGSTMDGWEYCGTETEYGAYGPWSDWSRTIVTGNEHRQVEQELRFRYSDKEATIGGSPSMAGWQLEDTTYSYGAYGPWSSWSTARAGSSDTRQAEEKTQYRSRELQYVTSYSAWGGWSDWSGGAVAASDTRQVETRTMYSYTGRAFVCSRCGETWKEYKVSCVGHAFREHEGGVQNEKMDLLYMVLKGQTGWDGSVDTISQHTNGYFYGIHTAILSEDGSLSVGDGYPADSSSATGYIIESFDGRVTQYRSRTRTAATTPQYSSWSQYRDDPIAPGPNREVETRTLYRFRDRQLIPLYHFSRWGQWSSWTKTEVPQSESRRVETAYFYRYRDQSIQTVYCFRRWTDWSGYSEIPAAESRTLEVRTRTEYRYRSK